MRGDRGFGQPCRARSENIITRIPQKQFAGFGQIIHWLLGNGLAEVDIASGHRVVFAVGDKQHFIGKIFRQASVEAFHIRHLLGPDDQQFRVDQFQAMRQHIISLAGVDHARNHTQFHTGQHGNNDLRPVFNINGDRIALNQPARFVIMGKLVDPRVQVGPANILLFKTQSRFIAQRHRVLFQIITDRALVAYPRGQGQFQIRNNPRAQKRCR